MLQARRLHLGSIRRHHVATTGLVDEERNATVQGKPQGGNADPHVPVHRQRPCDILRQLRQRLKVLSRQVRVPQRSDIRQGLGQGIVEREAGEEDQVDQGSGEDQNGADDEG